MAEEKETKKEKMAENQNMSSEPIFQFDLDLNELQVPALEAGQTGEVIIPVKVVRFGKEKVTVLKNGKARMNKEFRDLTSSEMRETLDVAER